MEEKKFYINLEEKVRILEERRLTIRSRFLKFSVLDFFILVIFLVVWDHIYPSVEHREDILKDILDIFFFVFVSSAFMIPPALYRIYQNKWRRFFKEELLSFLFNTFFPSYNYKKDSYISFETFKMSMLFADFPQPDEYTGEDFVEGWVGNTYIAFSEVRAIMRISWLTKVKVFKGVFFMVKLPKKVKSKVVVYPNAFRLYRKLAGLERVKLYDPEFENYFDVFSDNPVEAIYILNPNFTKRMLDFLFKTRAEVRFSFVDEYMFCAMDFGKNFFEPPFFFRSISSLIYQEGFRIYLQEIELLLSIAKELDI